MTHSSESKRNQTAVGVGVLVVGGLMALGALAIPSASGYAGIGPNFLPAVAAIALAACGGGLVWQARRGGFAAMETPSGAPKGDWLALGWVMAGVLANAALVTRIGFVLSCSLCFVLAVRGLRSAEGKPAGGVRRTLLDALTGVLIAAPVYWLFTKLLAINLPGLTSSGWI